MNKLLVGISIIILGIGVYYWLRKKRIKKLKGGLEKFLVSSDYQRIKTISPRSCLECGECVLENNGCCAGCVKSVEFTECQQAESHCLEHKHHHHHHKGDIKGYLTFILTPFLMGLVFYKVVKEIATKNPC